jgi:predicted enzyme related to lactoylglutathione lyase
MNKKVTGIGGVFFKCRDPKAVKDWYRENLGFPVDEYGVTFGWHPLENPNQTAYTQWSPFNESTDYFQPSTKEFMINYRVENLVELLHDLKENGVTILDQIAEYEYGKFVHIMDPEGNKIELWEPIDDKLH